MAPPVSKRRKTEHQSSDDDDDSASFASFDDADADEEDIDGGSSGRRMDVVNGSQEDGDSIDGIDEDDGGESDDEDTPVQPAKSAKPQTSDRRTAQKPTPGSVAAAYSAGSFKSNVFRLQVDELLEQVRPKRTGTETAAEEALHQLKSAIEKIPERESRAIEDAERQLLKDKIAVPFPSPRPPKDAKYKLAYVPPSNINVIGSHALKTSPRTKAGIELDMIVTMPSSLFQEKDYLNYRYFYRRSYYLACLAAGLRNEFRSQYSFEYLDWHDNPLKPIVVVRPTDKKAGSKDDKPSPKWRINIIPCVAENQFSKDKLSLFKNSVRINEKEGVADESATCFYNSTLRADMLMASYLKLLHTSSKTCNAFRDACLLGGTWLRQRSFGSSAHAGGFGNFEWCALMAALLQGGAAGGKSILSAGYSSYQLLKATMQVLAVRDLSKQPLSTGANPDEIKSLGDGTPVVWYTARAHNILYKMTPWSYRLLRQEARTTLSMLADQHFDAFDGAFIVRADSPAYRFDYTVDFGSASSQLLLSDSDEDPQTKFRSLYTTLRRALGDRVTLFSIDQGFTREWNITSSRPKPSGSLGAGFVVNPDTVNRTIDHGPSAENKADAASFREFWGEKAELRRFKDGSILESLVWSGTEEGMSVFEQIVHYIVAKYFPLLANKANIQVQGNAFQKMLPNSGDAAPFRPLMDAYKQLENDIRSLDNLPLSLRSIMPADPQMRLSSISAPLTKRRSMQSDVVIQFEGSARWPDDLLAIQRIKVAFLLNLSELLLQSVDDLTARVGLENGQNNSLNQGFLDVTYPSGAAFRIRIHHEREQNVLERQLKDKSIDPKTKETAALGLAKYKRNYLKSPAHTQAIARLCSRFAALSGTIRLMKKWFASHLLENHVAEEVIELLAAQTFVQPWPWQVPSSVQTGFLRTLVRLSRWNWRHDPLIVDFSGSGELKQADWDSINTKFEAWRKIDPALNRVVIFAASNVDQDGTTWTDGNPARVVAARMTALARAAVAEIDEKATALQPRSLFASSLTDFDFTIHLNASFTSKTKRSRKPSVSGVSFKNLEIDQVLDDASLVGFDPVKSFLDDLTSTYGSAVLFFSGGHERPAIAGLWHPHTATRNWRLNLAWSTVPRQAVGNQAEAQAELNRAGIIGEIARLGGDLVDRIEVKET